MTIKSRHALASLALASGVMLAASPALAQTAARGFQNPPVPREHAASIEAQGGLYEGPVATYVAKVGDRVAAAAGRGGQCGFHVVNSMVVNAFTSPPGCHVYITRGLLSVINTEAELAGALGHEIGHVNANHAGKRQNRSLATGLGALVLGAVTKSDQVAQIASQVGQLTVLSYSRNQEYEADTLGVQYLPKAGYPASGLTGTLQAIQREDQLEARQRGQGDTAVPGWLRTHPLTSDRIARAAQLAAKAPTVTPGMDGYLIATNGMLYGDDPAQGFVVGRAFLHPDLGFGFEAPTGFTLTNGPAAVTIEGPNRSRAVFAAGKIGGSRLEDYAVNLMRQAANQTPITMGQPQSAKINGVDSVLVPALARTANGDVEFVVVVYAMGGETGYQFLAQAPAGTARVFDPMFNSFHRITAAEVAKLRPRRIELVTVKSSDTVASLSARMAVEGFQQETFMAMNGLEPGAALKPGRRVKLVSATK